MAARGKKRFLLNSSREDSDQIHMQILRGADEAFRLVRMKGIFDPLSQYSNPLVACVLQALLQWPSRSRFDESDEGPLHAKAIIGTKETCQHARFFVGNGLLNCRDQ